MTDNVILTTKAEKYGKGFHKFFTNQHRQKNGSHPIIAYNLGLRRIAFQSSLQIHEDKLFILNLEEDELF